MSGGKVQAVGAERLEKVTGGAARPKFVSSFFCEKCGKTIRLNGVYTLEKALKDHNEKVHPPQTAKR